MNLRKHFFRVLTIALALILALSFTACDAASGEEEAETIHVLTMAEIKAEIDSKETTDFVETTETTEYIKITVRDHGDIILRLCPDVAPITVANFQDLVGKGYYNGITFHRVYKNFAIQGGDPDGDGLSDPNGPSIKGEFSSNGVPNHLSHVRGILSMARSRIPDSAYAQFFICDADSTFLDGDYAAFGYVIAGLETVDSITSVEVQYDRKGELSDPIEDVVMEKVCFVNPK